VIQERLKSVTADPRFWRLPVQLLADAKAGNCRWVVVSYAAPGLEDVKAGSGRAAQLLAAQVVAHPDHGLGDEVAAKLVS
jgi:hypothetical protein